MAIELYLKNDNTLACGVTYSDTGGASTAASVTAIVVERYSTGNVVENNLTLTQVNTDGTYEKLLDESSTGVVGSTGYTDKVWYTADVTVLTSDGVDGHIELNFQARVRRVS